jgi:hypothetical protein
MSIATLIISIIALMLSLWGVINIIGIFKTLDTILDIIKLHQINDSIKRGKDLTPEQDAYIKSIINENNKFYK